MKKTTKIQKTTVKIIISAIVAASIYSAIQYFHIGDYMMYGVWMAASWAPTTSGSPVHGTSLLLQPLQVVALLAPAIIIGFIFAIFKQQTPFRTAFISTMVAYFISKIVDAFFFTTWVDELIAPFLAMFVGYILAYLLVRKITKPVLTWAIILSLVLLNLFAIPHITKSISKPITDARQANELSSAVKDMKFTTYYPSYIPEGLETTKAKLEGYHSSAWQHQHVSYSVGKLEFMISEKLKNQEPVFNKTDNCDISAVWSTMRSKSEISQAKIDQSRDNLTICRMLGKTDDGYEVYIKANKSQFESYYMEIGDTIIVMQHDKLTRPRYANDFEKEVLKIFNSMDKLDTSKLTAGY